MSFNGEEGSIISVADGAEMTSRYREQELNPSQGVFIGQKLLHELLDQQGAKGIRFYFGMDDSNNLTLVLAAADSEEKDMLDKVGNRGKLCPPHSDVSSPLFEQVAVQASL